MATNNTSYIFYFISYGLKKQDESNEQQSTEIISIVENYVNIVNNSVKINKIKVFNKCG